MRGKQRPKNTEKQRNVHLARQALSDAFKKVRAGEDAWVTWRGQRVHLVPAAPYLNTDHVHDALVYQHGRIVEDSLSSKDRGGRWRSCIWCGQDYGDNDVAAVILERHTRARTTPSPEHGTKR